MSEQSPTVDRRAEPPLAVIQRGGPDTERLYLYDQEFVSSHGARVRVAKTAIPGVDMADLIARHKGRYCLLGLFSRPGYRLLDFPCGSGYAAELLEPFGVLYEGREIDEPTVEYARRVYGRDRVSFAIGDLSKPVLAPERYNVIGCVEGLEHVERAYQAPLITAFHAALKPGGTLVVSSPEAVSGVSGQNPLNEYHKWELTKEDFLALLHRQFGPNVELVTHRSVLHTGVLTTCLYGVCYKPNH